MTDKLNMTLDDIIKTNKKNVKTDKPGTSSGNNNNKNKNAGNNKPRSGVKLGVGKNNRRAPPAKNVRVALANKVLKRSKAIAARKAAGAGAQRRVFGTRGGHPVAAAGLSTVATKKLVNKLVKNALRKRTNITTAQVVRKRGGVAASTLATRRNLTIKRNVAAARGVIQPVRTVVQHVPVAPVRTIVQHVQPAPVRVVRQVIRAPQVETQVIRRGPPPQQQIRRNRSQQQHQQQRRSVVVQQVQQGRRFRQNNNNRRDDRPTVIRRQVVQQSPRRVPQYEQVVQRVIQAPVPQQRFQQQHQAPRRFQQQPQRFQQQPQRFQRQQQSGGNVRFVNAGPRQVQRNTVVRQVQQPVQYHPVQYVTDQVVTSRGRGFRAY